MDERSKEIFAKSMAITLALIYLGIFVSCIWKYVTTKDIMNCTWEIILIVMIPLSISWFARKDESLLIPKMMMTGKELPTELDEVAKKTRKGYYFWDALGLATVFLLLTIVDSLFIQREWDYIQLLPQSSEKVNILLTHTLEFFISVIIFYLIGYVWEEWRTRRYNKKMSELE